MAIEEPMSLGKNADNRSPVHPGGRALQGRGHPPDGLQGRHHLLHRPSGPAQAPGGRPGEPAIGALVARSLKEPFNGGLLGTVGGRESFVEVDTIRNEPACHHCHGASKPILGAMVLIKDISAEMEQYRRDQLVGGLISWAGLRRCWRACSSSCAEPWSGASAS